jgi:hypothetical protein
VRATIHDRQGTASLQLTMNRVDDKRRLLGEQTVKFGRYARLVLAKKNLWPDLCEGFDAG